jgi:hypothetical protein
MKLRNTAMARQIYSVMLVVAIAVAGCSREKPADRLARECGTAVDAAVDTGTTTNPALATVNRTEMEAVIRSEQWATTPQRKAIQAELSELDTSRGLTPEAYEAGWERIVNEGGERDAIWQAAFDNDLPRRTRLRDKMIRDCVAKRAAKEAAQ